MSHTTIEILVDKPFEWRISHCDKSIICICEELGLVTEVDHRDSIYKAIAMSLSDLFLDLIMDNELEEYLAEMKYPGRVAMTFVDTINDDTRVSVPFIIRGDI
jgi:hypothetical protein